MPIRAGSRSSSPRSLDETRPRLPCPRVRPEDDAGSGVRHRLPAARPDARAGTVWAQASSDRATIHSCSLTLKATPGQPGVLNAARFAPFLLLSERPRRLPLGESGGAEFPSQGPGEAVSA